LPLYLHNTLSREKERFDPIDPAHVRMYVCGPTVYDMPHIGNARPIVVFDVLFRLLRQLYGPAQVAYARNITDLDDKINAAARQRGISIRELTEETARVFHEDVARLGTLVPSVEPRATEHIPEMIALVERLIAVGHAYEADGHVLFHVPSMPAYGRLSRHNRDELIAGARVEVAPYKKDPADFVLWKPSDADTPGWDSRWGRGRPGWHLECSAMSEKHLGVPFDIHGGGQDLIFPHHENEIAQSTCAHPDQGFARYWVHNGYVVVEGEKMAKSLGNFVTLHDLLEEGHPGEAIKLELLSAHYRQPLNFTRDGLRRSKEILDKFYTALRKVEDLPFDQNAEAPLEVIAALEDDINTPLAIHHLHDQTYRLNLLIERGSDSERSDRKTSLLASGRLLGVLQQDPEAWFKRNVVVRPGTGGYTIQPFAPTVTVTTAEKIQRIQELIDRRAEYRKMKKFAEADHIRAELKAEGVELEDKPDGTTDWKLAR
jgi:cysteinyl-tRNA synthetase